MRIVFMGTPDFSAAVLEKLHEAYPVLAAVTGPDKMSGRGNVLKPSPLKVKAEELGIPVLQFQKVSTEGIDEISALKPDVIVTAAFGQILSEKFLAIPKFGVLNVHASLLPKLRGASPIQWAILSGEEYTGITIMRTVKEVDAGDILLSERVKILPKETSGQLFERLAPLGGEAIVKAIRLIESGKASFEKQDDSLATHCGMISKADGLINFGISAKRLDNFVRGMDPWPSAYTYIDGKMIKVFEVESASADKAGEVGEVLAADDKRGLIVQVADGAVRLKTIQPEGKRRMSDLEYLRGKSVTVGARLGAR